jgi:hypothetical protein
VAILQQGWQIVVIAQTCGKHEPSRQVHCCVQLIEHMRKTDGGALFGKQQCCSAYLLSAFP